jgi:hypothetical protein
MITAKLFASAFARKGHVYIKSPIISEEDKYIILKILLSKN